MNIDKEYLCRAKKNLEGQYAELTQKREMISNQLSEVKGARKWVEQTIKLLESKELA